MTLTAYFAHHAMYGRFGIENNRSLSAGTKVLADKLAVLDSKRAALQRDIALLSGEPHPDIVEEAARERLGYSYPHTIIVNLPR
jgi:cell division protein FtsB